MTKLINAIKCHQESFFSLKLRKKFGLTIIFLVKNNAEFCKKKRRIEKGSSPEAKL